MSLIDFDKKDGHPLWNVKNLLTVIGLMATLTFGMFVWDAERAINKLDTVDTNSAKTAAQVEVLVTTVGRIGSTQDQMASELTDHEKRITVLETVNSNVPTRFRGPR